MLSPSSTTASTSISNSLIVAPPLLSAVRKLSMIGFSAAVNAAGILTIKSPVRNSPSSI